mmetsp:Transcript_8199/g.17918  ORF Transcript_8199/g.17918 Transcript_8199/m.17918 type:complete len:210 (-) Transcript_8199:2717-3346(-)
MTEKESHEGAPQGSTGSAILTPTPPKLRLLPSVSLLCTWGGAALEKESAMMGPGAEGSMSNKFNRTSRAGPPMPSFSSFSSRSTASRRSAEETSVCTLSSTSKMRRRAPWSAGESLIRSENSLTIRVAFLNRDVLDMACVVTKSGMAQSASRFCVSRSRVYEAKSDRNVSRRWYSTQDCPERPKEAVIARRIMGHARFAEQLPSISSHP